MSRAFEKAVSKAADAMYKYESDQAALKVSQIDLDTDKYVRVFSTAMQETDRAAAILIFAYIEDCLCNLIARHFDSSIANIEELTRPNGLLATSSARLTMIAGLGWIHRNTFAALNLIRKIRNNFAHHVEMASFDHNVVKGLIASISQFEAEAIAAIAGEEEPRKFSARELFFLRAAASVNRLNIEGAVFPVARDHRVGPRDVMRAWGDGPLNIDELCRATSRITCHIYYNDAATPLSAEWLELAGRKKSEGGEAIAT